MCNSKENIQIIKFLAWAGWIGFAIVSFLVLTSTTLVTTQKYSVSDSSNLVHERSEAKKIKIARDSAERLFNIKSPL